MTSVARNSSDKIFIFMKNNQQFAQKNIKILSNVKRGNIEAIYNFT